MLLALKIFRQTANLSDLLAGKFLIAYAH